MQDNSKIISDVSCRRLTTDANIIRFVECSFLFLTVDIKRALIRFVAPQLGRCYAAVTLIDVIARLYPWLHLSS
jgi:hypothetical protein